MAYSTEVPWVKRVGICTLRSCATERFLRPTDERCAGAALVGLINLSPPESER
jgi:hypothetical protein